MILSSSQVPVASPLDFAPASSKDFLEIQATVEYGFTLNHVLDMTRQEHTVKCSVQISTQTTVQSFGQFGQMVECSIKN